MGLGHHTASSTEPLQPLLVQPYEATCETEHSAFEETKRFSKSETLNDWAAHLALDNNLLSTTGNLLSRANYAMDVFEKIYPPLAQIRAIGKVLTVSSGIADSTFSKTAFQALARAKKAAKINGFKQKATVMAYISAISNVRSVAYDFMKFFVVMNPITVAINGFLSAAKDIANAQDKIREAWHSYRKMDPVYLLEDRLNKYDRLVKAADILGSTNDEAKRLLQQEMVRVANQAKALANHVENNCYVTLEQQMHFQAHPIYQRRGDHTPQQKKLVTYLLGKQKRMARLHVQEAFEKSFMAIAHISFGMAAVAIMAFPPAAAGLAITGLISYGISKAINMFNSKPPGFKLFGYKSAGRKRYETVFKYMADQLSTDGKHPAITKLVDLLRTAKATAKQTGLKKDFDRVNALSDVLRQRVENILVRRELGLPEVQYSIIDETQPEEEREKTINAELAKDRKEIDSLISKNDRTRIVGLQCKKMIGAAKSHLNEATSNEQRKTAFAEAYTMIYGTSHTPTSVESVSIDGDGPAPSPAPSNI